MVVRESERGIELAFLTPILPEEKMRLLTKAYEERIQDATNNLVLIFALLNLKVRITTVR